MRILFSVLGAALFLFPSSGRAQKSLGEQKIAWADTTPYFKRRFPEKKGQLRFILGFPWINQYYLQPLEEPAGNHFGYWGYCGGFEYFYKPNRSLSATISYITNAPDFFVGALHTGGVHEVVGGAVLTLSNNMQLNRWAFGGGIQYTGHNWVRHYGGRFDSGYIAPSVFRNDHTMGLAGSAHYQLGKAFFAGIIYRPCVVRLYPEPAFVYQHSVSLDFSLKVGLRNKL